jgi:hypothetical protein
MKSTKKYLKRYKKKYNTKDKSYLRAKRDFSSTSSMTALELKERGKFYLGNGKHLRKDRGTLEIVALKCNNPKDKPFQHLSLKGIECFYPRGF